MTPDQQRSCNAMSRFWQHLQPGDPVGCMRTGWQGFVHSLSGQLVIIELPEWPEWALYRMDGPFRFATQLAHIDQPEVPKRS